MEVLVKQEISDFDVSAGIQDPQPADPKVDIPGQLKKLLASSYFRHSERYTNFLRFIVDCSIEGRYEKLKERTIGVEVLGKSPDFDTGNDTSVRVVANEVRKRLTLYYGRPEHQAELQIKIPVRSYVAEFCMPQPAGAEHGSDPSTETFSPSSDPPPLPAANRFPRLMRIILAAVVIVCGLAWGLYALRPESPIFVFWNPFLKGANNITVCVSPFFGVGLDAAPAQPHPVTDKPRNQLSYNDYREQHNGMAAFDVIAFSKIAAFLQGQGKAATIRSAHATSLSDLDGVPVILLGGFHNQWTMRFEAEHRFHCQRDQSNRLRWIEDAKQPGNHSWIVDGSAALGKITVDYLLVSRVFNQATGQWWMSINGLTAVGTIVGARALIDPKTTAELTAGLPNGWQDKNFQMVLGFNVVDGSPGVPRRLAFYSW